jgi:aarF domain-containing kinase
MTKEFGNNWPSHFHEFNHIPIAAASIGQVHQATLSQPTTTNDPSLTRVAVKVQYPGVAASIDSDLAYLKTLTLMGSLLPKGLYLDNTIRVAAMELGWECDYVREAEAMMRFAGCLEKARVRGFRVPRVVRELSTRNVITSEWVDGVPIGSILHLSQEKRDEVCLFSRVVVKNGFLLTSLSIFLQIGDRLLRLCLKELFEFRFMQTDPNWSNFLYDEKTDTVWKFMHSTQLINMYKLKKNNVDQSS